MSTVNINEMSIREKTSFVCLFFARLHKSDERYKKCFKYLNLLAEKYEIKPATLKNDRQAYDHMFSDNGREGWHDKPLAKRSKLLYEIYEAYKDLPLEEAEVFVEQIIHEAENEGQPFFSLKTKDEKTVRSILEKEENIEFDGLNILQDSLKIGQVVFIVLGGDKPAWKTGLIGMGIISQEPYDIGYSGKNYKIKVDIKLLLDKPIKREDLVPYRDTYGIIGIAPIVKWEPNQAISQLSEKSAIALMRAMLEICQSIDDDLTDLLPVEIIERIKGATTMFVPVQVNYKENIKESIKQSLEESESEEPVDEISWEDAEEYTSEQFLNDVFMDKSDYETLCNLLDYKKNIILQGAPGVGKTYAAKRLAYSILGKKYDKCIDMVQFHQSYSYEDFVVGFRPTTDGFELSEGPFYAFCTNAVKDDKKHFFIIDEINRGNLSKIFGELLMLIEADKRSETLKILYKNKPFNVPENVYIIGMMNTADRSLAMIDYALRRRFSFFEMKPAFDSEKFKGKLAGSCEKVNKVITVIKELNGAISEDETLGRGFQIGHSYFCFDKPIDDAMIKMIVEYEIIPLINEYWFDEPTKISTWTERLRGALA